jgi:porphobilinogen synthase
MLYVRMLDLSKRPRRLRYKPGVRTLVAENVVRPADLVYPLFVRAGASTETPIASMPGISQWPVSRLTDHVAPLVDAGLKGVILFGIPQKKDAAGTSAWDARGPVPEAARALRKAFPHLAIFADVCLCEYTDHGHCGPLSDVRSGAESTVINDAAVEGYVNAALAYAEAGADFVAPSGMMDGAVGIIRKGLDAKGFLETGIMAYSAKYASNFYGPFRDAAESPPQFGDRRSYQMDVANSREALREVELDIAEGADIVMVKPAMAYGDIIKRVRDGVDVPVAAYNVSGEYAMVKAAIEKGWVSPAIIEEVLLSIKRAGAEIIITYFAPDYLLGQS